MFTIQSEVLHLILIFSPEVICVDAYQRHDEEVSSFIENQLPLFVGHPFSTQSASKFCVKDPELGIGASSSNHCMELTLILPHPMSFRLVQRKFSRP